MMRSMYSGVAGLKVHQTKMDVIGNNIANVNTIGFKSQKVSFSDLFYQTSQIASGPNEEGTKGGSNARQVGLGTTVARYPSNITASWWCTVNRKCSGCYDKRKQFFHYPG